MKWFSLWWYKFLFQSSDFYNAWCRARNHPNGVWYYTTDPSATEPDMHCKDCGEDLG